MQITLADDVRIFVEEQVRLGTTPSAAALVNDALRAFSGPQKLPFEIDANLESWLLDAADSPTAPLVREDFDGIKERVRNRLSGR